MDMNFNEFQDAWKNDEGNQEALSFRYETVKKANQPIDSIRRNMKNELYYQLGGILIIALLPLFYKIPGMGLITYYALFTLLLIISFYYFSRFYQLFKKMHNYNLNVKDNLYELYYETRLHIEMYKSFSFLLLPFIIFITGIIIYAERLQKINSGLEGWDGSEVVFFLTYAIIITLIMVLVTNWWVNRFYGKYAKRIRKILDELKD
jgi:hypothetical protein